MQMRSDKIFGDLFMHIYCRVSWWKNFIFGRYLAKLYTRVYSVSISDVLFDQQLLPRNLLHTCHTLCLKKYRLTLDVWQWLLKMWTDFQNSFTIWFVWKFSMYKPQINSKIKKNITEFPRLMWTCHKYTILFTFVCYVFVVVGVVNFPEICQSFIGNESTATCLCSALSDQHTTVVIGIWRRSVFIRQRCLLFTLCSNKKLSCCRETARDASCHWIFC